MNSLINKQLQNCKVADLSNYNSETNTYTIPKYNQVRVEECKSYLVQLDRTLLIPNPGDVFHINWNRGSLPGAEEMVVEVDKINGKTIYVDGVGFDSTTNTTTTYTWSGWLPLDKIKIVKEI